MQTAIRKTVTVDEQGKIELTIPDLPPGAQVEVIVRVEEQPAMSRLDAPRAPKVDELVGDRGGCLDQKG